MTALSLRVLATALVAGVLTAGGALVAAWAVRQCRYLGDHGWRA